MEVAQTAVGMLYEKTRYNVVSLLIEMKKIWIVFEVGDCLVVQHIVSNVFKDVRERMSMFISSGSLESIGEKLGFELKGLGVYKNPSTR